MRTSHWQAESLRLTVFLTTTSQPKAEGWWSKLSGGDPETRNAKPRSGELFEAGNFQGSVLSLALQPGRVDWFLSPSLAQEDESAQIRSLGNLHGAVNTFSAAMLKWLEECPPAVRLAYGGVLLEPVHNKEAGYLRLSELVHGVKIDPSSEDFFYQINKPRDSKTINDLRLNRLSKWSVAMFQPMRVAFGIPQNQPGQPMVYSHTGTPSLACRVELDLSSCATSNELPHSMLAPLFTELVSLGTEIAEQGDVQ
jgi:hypothetical protein